jgi:hypothetical protein
LLLCPVFFVSGLDSSVGTNRGVRVGFRSLLKELHVDVNMDTDIQRLARSAETGREGIEMSGKDGHGGGGVGGLDVEEAGDGVNKRSRLRMIAIITALFVRLTLFPLPTMLSSMNEIHQLPSSPSPPTH